jgi:hypothetical protein
LIAYVADYELLGFSWIVVLTPLPLVLWMPAPQRESQHVVFMLDPESDQFTYSDVRNRIQLRKTKVRVDAHFRCLWCALKT